MKKKPNLKARLAFLYIGSFIVCIAPLVTLVGIRWDNYVQTPGDAVKLSIGGMMAILFLFLKIIGKLHMPRRIVLFGVVFVMAYLLQPILNDFMLISGMAFAGELLDLICFQHAIKLTREALHIEKQANATTAQVEEVFKKYIGNGRV